MNGTALGQYLRARREQLRPEDVGLAWSGRRRVPGLRREEIALLAGVSSDYYLRLEQGRDIRPSVQVIDALARALQLDEHATAHLHALASPHSARAPVLESERAPAHIEQLIASWSHTPAFVHSRYMDVLATNALMTAISPAICPGANLVRVNLLDPYTRAHVHDWDKAAQRNVARLRAMAGAEVESPRLRELVDELSARSPEFTDLWSRHDIEVTEPQRYVLDHPLVGRLELLPVRLAIVGAENQFMIVQHTDPGSPSEHALARLAAIATGEGCP